MKRDRFYIPRGYTEAEKTPLDRFRKMNSWVMRRGCWITSLPGREVVTIDCPIGSSVPDELRDAGYVLDELGFGERVDHGDIRQVERFSFSIGDER